ncbi:acyclic terpene utilization family protein AtuA [Aureococcus anophagefferens]|nr:acyclic terpene utilization family protein AtuA [Aureococcus anophagefferens]
MAGGGSGYDPRLPQWLGTLLPACAARGTKLICNLGAADPAGGARVAAAVAGQLNLDLTVVGVGEAPAAQARPNGAVYAYLGADAVARALRAGADVVVARPRRGPSLFVGCVAHALDWDLDAPATVATAAATCMGHLLECGLHATGGYFFHPRGRQPERGGGAELAALGLPYAVATATGLAGGGFEIRKARGRPGELSRRTLAQQLLYEVSDPGAYVTPDVVADFSGAVLEELSESAVAVSGVAAAGPRPEKLLRLVARDGGRRQVGEISFLGSGCRQRADWAEEAVRIWMDQECPGSSSLVRASRPGYDALRKRREDDVEDDGECRLRFEGRFPDEAGALALAQALAGLGVGGPAGSCGGFLGGSPFGSPVVDIGKELVARAATTHLWTLGPRLARRAPPPRCSRAPTRALWDSRRRPPPRSPRRSGADETPRAPVVPEAPAPPPPLRPGQVLQLYDCCHARAGDKGQLVNVSLVAYAPWAPHFDAILAALEPALAGVFEEFRDAAAADALTVRVFRMANLAAANITVAPRRRRLREPAPRPPRADVRFDDRDDAAAFCIVLLLVLHWACRSTATVAVHFGKIEG